MRPEKIFLDAGDPHDNEIWARFIVRHYVGDFIRYYFELHDGTELTVKALNDITAPKFQKGERARLMWQQSDCFAFRTQQ